MTREKKILERHIRHWRGRGLVSAELEGRLRAASEELAREGAGSMIRGALALLGGGLLLAGLVLIVAENWPAIPRGAKLGAWTILQAGFLFGAHHLGRRWPDRPFLAEALALVAGGWVLAGIALVSQIYHLDARPPNGIWLWLALILPGAWAVPRRATTAVVYAALVTALGLEVEARDSWLHATSAASPWLWLGLPLLASALVSRLPRSLPALADWVGAWVFGAGQLFLLVLGAAQELDESSLGRGWLVAAAGLLAALAVPERVLPRAWDATTSRLVLAATVAPWALLGARFDRGQPVDELAIGLSWLVQLGLAVLVIRAGARSASRAWVNLGYLALLAGILTRYFDFFGNYLEGGAALAATGTLVLFVLYALEKARRRTLAREATS